MKTIEAIATVTSDGQLILQVPPDIMPGTHRIILVLNKCIEVDPSNSSSDAQLSDDDPIFSLGKNPIKCGISDAVK